MLQTLKTQQSNYIKLKKADGGKQSFSKLTGSGSGQISARIRPEPDPGLFFKLISGWIRIQAKNCQIRPDPEPDLGSSRSLINSITLLRTVFVRKKCLGLPLTSKVNLKIKKKN